MIRIHHDSVERAPPHEPDPKSGSKLHALHTLPRRFNVPETRGAFGVRPVCRRFRFMVPMRGFKTVAARHEPPLSGRHPAARTWCHPFLRVDCFDAFSAGLEAPAVRQAGCLPLRFRGSTRVPEAERRPPARLNTASDPKPSRAGGRRSNVWFVGKGSSHCIVTAKCCQRWKRIRLQHKTLPSMWPAQV